MMPLHVSLSLLHFLGPQGFLYPNLAPSSGFKLIVRDLGRDWALGFRDSGMGSRLSSLGIRV